MSKVLEICSDEELKAFAEMSAWCYKNRVRIHLRDNIEDEDLKTRPKPRKVQKPSWLRQKEREAIQRLINPGSTQ